MFPDPVQISNYSKEMNIKNMLRTNGTLINKNNASLHAGIFDTIQMTLDSSDEEKMTG